MQLTYDAYSLFPLLALIIALVLAIRVWPHRTRHLAITFLVLMSALAWWSLAAFMESASLELSAKVIWMKMTYPGVTIIPVAWLVFTLQYTDREKWLTRRSVALLTVVPLVTLIMVWSNDIHHLMWKDIWLDTSMSPPVDAVTHNTWFWINAAYAYSLLLLGTLCLFSSFRRSSGLYRKQAGTLLLAALVPWAVNILFIAGVRSFSVVDPTPLAFAITGIAFFWGLSRFQLLDIMPIAHGAILKSIVDAVIVLDTQQRIIELNPAAQRIVGRKRSEIIGRPYNKALPGQAGLLEPKPGLNKTEALISIGEGQAQRYYSVYISPVGTSRQVNGHVVLLHDDTERRKAEVEARGRDILSTELAERQKAHEELKQSEEALRKSEAKLRNLFESMAQGVVYHNVDGRVISANPAALEILGLPLERFLGDNILDSPWQAVLEDGSSFQQEEHPALVGLRSGKEVRDVVLGFIHARDGKHRWIKINAVPEFLPGDGTKPYQVFTTFDDITPRKEMEGALIGNEQFTSSLLANSPNPIIVINADDSIQYVNPSFEELTGYLATEIIGAKPPFPYWPKNYLQQYNLDYLDEELYKCERLFQKKNGELFCVELGAKRIMENGRIKYHLVNWINITERKKAEEALKESEAFNASLIDNAPNPIIVTNLDTSIRYVNRAFESLSGYSNAEVVGKKSPYPWWPQETLEQFESENVSGALMDLNQKERCYRKKNGELFWVVLSIKNVKDKDKGEFHLGNWVDITERKIMEEERREIERKAQLANRLASIGQMAAGIAHEINNPLTSITMLSQMLVKDEMPKEDREDLLIINSEAKRAGSIVKNLLTFARRDAPMRQQCQINRIWEDVLKLRNYEHKANNIQVNTQLDPNLPEVYVDSGHMQQVFLNLVLNAEQAMIDSHHRGRLTVITKKNKGKIQSLVVDDGPGISPENMHKLFSPFFTTKDVGKGTGLGLSISFGIVTNHGGRIYAESEPGKGATFVVELPINGHKDNTLAQDEIVKKIARSAGV